MGDLGLSFSIFAPAKVNLYLHVGPVRDDGRHPLDSLVVFADHRASDRITYVPGEGVLDFAIDGPLSKHVGLSDREDNLIIRAVRALEARSGQKIGGRLTLEKHLPIAAGIGGGSSDAAATLILLNKALSLGLSQSQLVDLSKPLGGDLPVCVAGYPILMRDDGSRILPSNPLPPDLKVLMVTPNIECPTGPVFQRFDEMTCPPSFEESLPPQAISFDDWVTEWREGYTNDLTEAAISVVPEIAILLDRLRAFKGALHAVMSGSGATCICAFETSEEVHAAALSIRSEFPEWFVAETRLGNAEFDLREHSA